MNAPKSIFFRLYLAVLMLVFSVKIIYPIAVIINFQLNKEFISNNVCIQREVKNNCCKGSCDLNEKLNVLQESDNNNQNIPISKTSKDAEILFLTIIQNWNFEVCEFQKSLFQNDFFSLQNGYTELIKPPPQIG
jgi:hypothetical protein